MNKFFSAPNLFVIVFFVLLTLQGFSEGSKQIWIDNHETNLYLCSDFTNQCNNGNGDRTQFAIYGCDPPDRLYFVTNSNNETVYLGFQGSGAGNQNHIVYRIKNASGFIVRPQANLPTSGAGYISNIGQARVGPTQFYGAGGYTAISFHPSTPGVYYIEFDRVANSSGNSNPGSFSMDLFDITVADTVASQVKPGRVFSKAWQLQENGGDNCYATFYVYSNDSIITSLALNNMSGGVWVTFCNQYGCANTSNFVQDRKSLSNQQAFVPQFNIFLNPPDPVLFPSATTLGQIIPPVTGVRSCDNGNILFQVTVDKPGNVAIELDFDPPYATRTLATSVVAGLNQINWDGLDGTTPIGIPVPNNVNISFTVSYINGLTNLPLYDVEANNSGFTIGLVSPPGSTPLVFWDDSNISGGTTNFTGCLSPPGCHPWSDGDHHTMNTWWYNVSTTTTPVNITQWRKPQTLLFNQSPPQSYCAGTNSVMFSVGTDPNTTIYHWNYTGTGATIIHTNPTDAFIMVNFAANATSGNIQVYGTNSNCTDPGPTSSLAVTIKPRPSVNPPFTKSICSGTSTNITLVSTPTGASFSWNSNPPTCSANIVSCPPGSSGGTINNLLSISNLVSGSVTYHILPTLSGCNGTVQDMVVTVNPLPNVVITSTTPSICSGGTTDIQLSSTVPSAVFNWTATPSSPNLSGYTPTGSGNILQTISNSGFTTETVTYSITPTVNGCTPTSPTNYIVTVYPTPNLSTTPLYKEICNGQSTNIALLSNVTGTTFTWSCTQTSGNVTGWSANPGPGTTSINQTLNLTGVIKDSVYYHLTPQANGCNGSAYDYKVVVNPVPQLTVSPMFSSICSQEFTNIQLTATCAGTSFNWTATQGVGTITGFSDGTGDLIAQQLSNSLFTDGSVVYAIIPSTSSCTGLAADYTQWVKPLPDVLINSTTPSICSGLTTSVLLSSSVAGTTLNWTAMASSPNVTGYSPSGSGDILETITNSGFTVETVTYTIMPVAFGCSPAVPTTYVVTIYPIPNLIINSTTPSICSGETTNILLSSSVADSTLSWTATASSPNVTGFSSSGTGSILETISNTGSTTETVTYEITPSANGCSPAAATSYTVTIYPIPDLTVTPGTLAICSGQVTNLTLQSTVAGTAFSWTASASSPNISGYLDGTGNLIAQPLVNSGYTTETATYEISVAANGCSPAAPTPYSVTVYPVADVIFTPTTQTLCSGETTGINVTSNVTGTSFVWVATGSTGNVSGYSNGSGTLIQQTLINAGYLMPTVTYQVTPTANSCTGTQNSAVVTVNPLPVVSMTVCFDTLTTTQAQPFALKGAIPPGGVFSGPGLTGSTFFPAIAGVGVHHIRYTYTNDFGCLDSASITIHITNPVSHICGDTLTDLRDNNNYPTVLIGSQCWMANNLNFGTMIPSSQIQRDNCIPEKYCYNDNPALCALGSVLYQWDEAMRYTSDNAAQGFCPPGWHIPTEADWTLLFTNFISNGFAGNALKSSGYSGFNALMTGIRFQNLVWKFPDNDPILRSKLYWSSSIHGLNKAWAHGMNEVVVDIDYTPSVSLYPALVSNDFAVRCIKD
ncbi:MAG: hypothetical protein IH596_00460 [Bacteroidales bacterium]|nr:hypothetical protein [Bacteroidales bacterium]